MYTITDVKDKIGSIRFCDGHGHYLKANLTGSTFPVVPIGTVLQDLSVKFPGGLQALSFFCRADQPRQLSHSQVDTTILQGALVLLCWEENGKVIAKDNTKWSSAELAKFNHFMVTDTSVLVVDTEHKIVYASSLQSFERTHPTWTSKAVSMDAILEYIVKRITLEELDARAISEQKGRDELAELRVQARNQNESIKDSQAKEYKLEGERERLSNELAWTRRELLEEQKSRSALGDSHDKHVRKYQQIEALVLTFENRPWRSRVTRANTVIEMLKKILT